MPVTVKRLVAVFQRKFAESKIAPAAPMNGMRPLVKLEMARDVVVALVVVELTAVKFWRVVEPITNRSPAELKVEVAVPPKYAFWNTESWEVDALVR